MPGVVEALLDGFRGVADSGAAERTAHLGSSVFTLSCERFAWNGWHDLKADIVLDYLTEDAALDALAEYIWANRHAGPVASCPNPEPDMSKRSTAGRGLFYTRDSGGEHE